MKKLFLVAAIAVFGISNTYAQKNLEIGVNFAFPVGDAEDFSTFTLGLDVAYLFEVTNNFKAGFASGITNSFGESYRFLGENYDYDDVQFIPVAVAGRFYPTKNIYLGGDIGYAIGISTNNDGGFYYRPKIGYSLTNKIGVNISYTGISLEGGGKEISLEGGGNGVRLDRGGNWDTIGIGFEFSF